MNTTDTINAGQYSPHGLLRGMALGTYFITITVCAIGAAPMVFLFSLSLLAGYVSHEIMVLALSALLNLACMGITLALLRARAWHPYTFSPQAYLLVTSMLMTAGYVNFGFYAPVWHFFSVLFSGKWIPSI